MKRVINNGVKLTWYKQECGCSISFTLEPKDFECPICGVGTVCTPLSVFMISVDVDDQATATVEDLT